MPLIVVLLAVLGLAGIVSGGFAMRLNWRTAKSRSVSRSARRWFVAAVSLGLLLGAASWPLTYFMGYPLKIEAETGRVVGLPFFVAYFDSLGRDYVGPLTMPGVFANALFWFFVPQFALLWLARRWANPSGRAEA
jgi:hypothetical protein